MRKTWRPRIYRWLIEAAGTTFYAGGILNFQLYTPDQNQALSPEDLSNRIVRFVENTVQEVLLRAQTTHELQEGKGFAENDQHYQTLLPVLETYGVTNRDLQYLKTAMDQKNIPVQN